MLCQAIGNLDLAFISFLCRAPKLARGEVRAFEVFPECAHSPVHAYGLLDSRNISEPYIAHEGYLNPTFLLVSVLVTFLFTPTVITASGNSEAKQLSLVVFQKYPVEKAVHSERTLGQKKTSPVSGGFFHELILQGAAKQVR